MYETLYILVYKFKDVPLQEWTLVGVFKSPTEATKYWEQEDLVDEITHDIVICDLTIYTPNGFDLKVVDFSRKNESNNSN